MAGSSSWGQVAQFYAEGIRLVRAEINARCEGDGNFTRDLKALSTWVSTHDNLKDRERTIETIWSVFCPEATGIRGREREQVEALRKRRAVTITEPAASPIRNPIEELLLTSNALLTLPPAESSLNELPLVRALKEELRSIAREPQLYWYDHPIHVNGDADSNEVVYGLHGLEEALAFEKERGTIPAEAKVPCLLSVSVTHRGLLVEEVLEPAAERYLQRADAREPLSVFGVDGEYGRHYSFLKAIAAFWSVFIQPAVRATFKIDLDQVFPQEALVKETGASAFEHLRTPLWGARGTASDGQPVELGMIAGALVNQGDIHKSLFTPDVPFPSQDALSVSRTLPGRIHLLQRAAAGRVN
jgi:hypothetical protein